MAAIKGKDTKPELLLRKKLYSMGYRYRIHYKVENTKVDIAFISKKKVINVHGCFWHQHKGCKEASQPKTNSEFWQTKFRKNIARDKRNNREVKNFGWDIKIVWECELEKDFSRIISEIIDFLN